MKLVGIGESVLKTCVTLRGLGDNSCHLVESPLNFDFFKAFATVLEILVFYSVTIQSIVSLVDLVLTLPSFQMARSE